MTAASSLMARGLFLLAAAVFALWGTARQLPGGEPGSSHPDLVAVISLTSANTVQLTVCCAGADLPAARPETSAFPAVIPLDYQPAVCHMGPDQTVMPGLAVLVPPGSSLSLQVAWQPVEKSGPRRDQVSPADLAVAPTPGNRSLPISAAVQTSSAAPLPLALVYAAKAKSDQTEAAGSQALPSEADLKKLLTEIQTSYNKLQARVAKIEAAVRNAEMAAADAKVFSDKAEAASDRAEAAAAKNEAIAMRAEEYYIKMQPMAVRAEKAARNAEMAVADAKAHAEKAASLLEKKTKP